MRAGMARAKERIVEAQKGMTTAREPEAESAVAGGVVWKSGVGVGRGIVRQVPAGFGRMAGLAIGCPGAGVVDEFAGAGVEAALKMIPFPGIVLMRGVEGEIVGDAVAADVEE